LTLAAGTIDRPLDDVNDGTRADPGVAGRLVECYGRDHEGAR
jgi:hypothetical protein